MKTIITYFIVLALLTSGYFVLVSSKTIYTPGLGESIADDNDTNVLEGSRCGYIGSTSTDWLVDFDVLFDPPKKRKWLHYYPTYTSPCYQSDHLVELYPRDTGMVLIWDMKKLSDSVFNSLNAYDHFVHSISYPEWYFQSCSMFSMGDSLPYTIPAEFLMQGEGLRMSQRQREALREHRDSSILLIRQCISERQMVSDIHKRVLFDLDAYEAVPDLIDLVEDTSIALDPYVLTTLCKIMSYHYPGFIVSDIYKKLYLEEEGKEVPIPRYKRSIPYTPENHKAIVNLAKRYVIWREMEPGGYSKVEAGTYVIGARGHSNNPIDTVDLKSFEISRYEVTNRQFRRFVESTGYITTAERRKDAMVFRIGLDEFEWIQDSTANWRFPNGVSQGGIEDKLDHPVTCISFVDAQAYCTWARVRLPTYSEWEVASRGGSKAKCFFGDSIKKIYEYANIWHGRTHLMEDPGEDYLTTSPVASFLPNPIGLYDIYGNVFEFCSGQPEPMKKYKNIAVTRGGSWWCSFTACSFFNSVDVGRVKSEASFSNNGFRVVR